MNKYTHILILALLPVLGMTQIEITHVTGSINNSDDLWELEIRKNDVNEYQLQISLELMKNNRPVYQAICASFSMVEQIKLIKAQMVQPIQVTRNEIDVFEGEYRLRVQIIDSRTREMIVQEQLRIEAASTSISDSDREKSKALKFGGEAFLSGQVASMQGIGSAIPRNYFRAEAYPHVSLYGIPVGLDIFLSTEQNALRQSMNQVSLNFDAELFKQQMQQKLEARVEQLEVIGDPSQLTDLEAMKSKVIAKKFPQLAEWEAQLEDPDIRKGLQQLKQLEAIQTVLKSPEISGQASRLSKLRSKGQLSVEETDEVDQLEAFFEEIEKLKTKAEDLQAIAKKYEQYKDLGAKVAKARRYANNDVLKDKEFFKEGIKDLDIGSKAQQILSGFDAINVGTVYPYYSRLSLSSLNVNGIHVEWNPGKIYLAGTYGQSSRMTLNNAFVTPELTLAQTTLAAKIGYGAIGEDHIHFSFVDIQDRFDDLVLDNDTKAQANRIVGVDGQWAFLDDKLRLGGEVMTSLFTRDKTIDTDAVQEFDKKEIPLSFLMGTINNSSSFDIAWRAFGDIRLFDGGTQVKGSVERVGPDYISLGAPVLLNNLIRWKAEVRQNLFNNKFSFSAFARQDANDLNPLLETTRSITTSYGLNGNLRIPKWPSVTFSYAPYAQRNEIISTNENLSSDATILNVIVGYPVKIGESISGYSQVSFMKQDLNSDIPRINYNVKMYGVTQTITYKRSSLNVSMTYTPDQKISDEVKNVFTLNSSGSIQLFEKWSNSLGIQWLSVTCIIRRY